MRNRTSSEVLRAVAEGNSNQRFGASLGLSEDTIKAHMKTILQKLDVRDRTHAVMIALRRGYWEANQARMAAAPAICRLRVSTSSRVCPIFRAPSTLRTI